MTDGTTGERFCHLHNHSHYSLLDGLSKPEALVQAAVDNGFKSLALTDHGTCGGLLSFQKACLDKGIKPILGNEVYICDDHQARDMSQRRYHLILLAKNKQGIQNLMRLTSIAEKEGKYVKPRIDFDLLTKYHEGLICSTACPIGELSMALWHDNEKYADAMINDYRELFGDDFYIEIMVHKYFEEAKDQEKREKILAKRLLEIAKKHGVKAIATNDAHYGKQSDAEYQDLLLAIQTHDHIKNPDRKLTFSGDEFYLKSYEEMYRMYKSVPEILSNTVEISEKVETNLFSFTDDLLPHYSIPPEFKSEELYLKTLVKDGMKKKGVMDRQVYRDRIKYEMEAIIRCGYVRYFLVLWDIINYANRQGIRVGIGRGSAVGSLCLYVLGVTKLDPIEHDLLFERFINPERISPPDVDVDFDYYRRDEIFDYVCRKYGNDKCCKIGTYNTFKARAVIRYGAKALDIGNDYEATQALKEKNPGKKVESTKYSLDLADLIAKQIPIRPGTTIESALRDEDAFRHQAKKYPKLIECARHLEGTISSAGVHPAGIVVCKEPIDLHVPLRKAKGDVICSQFDGPEVEELGLLKFDFLALKTLTVVEDTVRMIEDRYGKTIDVDKLKPNDPKVFGLFNGRYSNMDNRGIFQFEASGISKLLREIHVDRFDDMVVTNALYRPGPLGAGVHNLYCDYKHGRKAIEPLHPQMGEILKDTYGIMVFQENFMKVAQKMAGFTGGQSDTLRKAVGKKKADLLAKQKDLFIDGCVKNGIERSIATKIFEQIDYFGGYGFNKSHSAAYAFLAYQTAYLKVYYPLEFMCSLLSSEINNNDKNKKLFAYVREAQRMGIVIKKCDINRSGLKFRVEEGIRETSQNQGDKYFFIRSPLTTLKGVGQKAVDDIVSMQPFKNLKDFLHRVDGRKVNSRVFEGLVMAGCMEESWGLGKSTLLKQYKSIKDEVDKEKHAQRKHDERIEKFGGSIFDRF